jgi:hypothetical protein
MTEKVIISSTHIDSDGEKMTKECLCDIANSVNSDNRKPAMNIEHDITIPPLGRSKKMEVIRGKDEEYYLIAENEYYEKREIIKLENGNIYIKESFNDDKYSLRINDLRETDELEIVIDPHSFSQEKYSDLFFKEIRENTALNFKEQLLLRKSELPDPLIIYKLTPLLALSYFGIKLVYKYLERIAEKVGDKTGDEVVKFIDMVIDSSKRLFKNVKLKNKNIVHVFEITGEIKVQMVIKTNNYELLIDSLSQENMKKIDKKIEVLLKIFNPDFIQFLYNIKNGWEFNYLIETNGNSVGTYKAFERRKYYYNKFAEKKDKYSFEGKEFTKNTKN